MSARRPDIFELTMQGFEAAFRVRHVATFNLATCPIDEQVRAAWQRFADYDQLGVEDQGRVVGVLERQNSAMKGAVRDTMRPLDESILVSADEPLVRFIPIMAHPPYYRLVLDGARIDGIVTRSDLLKLPVRLLAFALITHLEMMMADIIVARYPEGEWLDLLSAGRRERLINKREDLRRQRNEPPLIELADFADKREIVREIRKLPKKFEEELESIERLRNQLAHAATYVEDDDDLSTFVRRIQLAEKWIDAFNGAAT